MKATFIQSTRLTDVIVSFSFQPAKEFSYTAGQFIQLTLLGHTEEGLPAKRWFTLSSSPHEDYLTITTRVGKAAHTPFKRALEKLRAGDEVDISEPLGDFVLPRLLQTPLVFIAGGIGVTPFRSILAWLAFTDERRPIKMFYAVRSEDDIVFQDTFDAAKQHVTVVVDQPSAAWGGERGQLTAEQVLGLDSPSEDTLYYISGPEPFVRKMQTDLQRFGIAHQRIVLDEFQGYTGV